MRPRRSVTLAHGSSTSTEARGSQYSTRTRGGVHPQSRSQSGSQSPTKQDHGSKSARGAGTNHSTSTEDDDEEDEEAEGEEDLGLDPEMSKLEKKRERNRDKQRKLRRESALPPSPQCRRSLSMTYVGSALTMYLQNVERSISPVSSTKSKPSSARPLHPASSSASRRPTKQSIAHGSPTWRRRCSGRARATRWKV